MSNPLRLATLSGAVTHGNDWVRETRYPKEKRISRKNFDFAQILHNSKFSIYNQKQAGRSWGGDEGSFGLPAPGCG